MIEVRVSCFKCGGVEGVLRLWKQCYKNSESPRIFREKQEGLIEAHGLKRHSALPHDTVLCALHSLKILPPVHEPDHQDSNLLAKEMMETQFTKYQRTVVSRENNLLPRYFSESSNYV